MCGKLNPPERVECQFCHARLIPLQATPPESGAGGPMQPFSPQDSEHSPDEPIDWLRSLRQGPAEPAAEAEETHPDLDSSQEPFVAQGQQAEGLDWLTSLRGPAELGDEEVPEDAAQETGSPEEPSLDWTGASPQAAGGPGGESDWLASMRLGSTPAGPGSPEPQAESGDPSSGQAAGEGGLPSEESVFPSEEGDFPSQGTQPEPSELDDQEPEWLRRIRTRHSIEQQPAIEAGAPSAPADEPIPFPPPDPDNPMRDNRLDWLTGLGDQAEQGIPPTPPPSASDAPFTSDNQADLSESEPLDGADLPDWLKDMKPAETGAQPKTPFSEDTEPKETGRNGEAEPGLAPADLPTWLEAMRPVESAAPFTPTRDESEDQVENAGPLSGLRGVLPAEPDVAQVQKPPAYSAKLQVSEANRSNAAMLEQMVKNEGTPRPLPRRSAISSQQFLRIGIAVVLFLVVLWPLVTGSPKVKLPDFPIETGVTNQLINQLPSGAPVLVAVDFEPGLSGEMNAASAALVDHLILRGAYLTLVSTSPTGPAQAEQLLALSSQSSGFSNPVQVQYANLGFIPGGAAGLLSFAQAPRQMMPFTTDGSPVWESGPLQNIASLDKFGMVLVITDNPDKARAWIEQVQPTLGSTPLVMAISAQAEPMVRPYYEARPQQVQGLVTGLAGGAAYENLNGRLGLAAPYWNAFSLGLLAAALLILLGGAVNALIALWARRKKAAGGEASR